MVAQRERLNVIRAAFAALVLHALLLWTCLCVLDPKPFENL